MVRRGLLIQCTPHATANIRRRRSFEHYTPDDTRRDDIARCLQCPDGSATDIEDAALHSIAGIGGLEILCRAILVDRVEPM